MSERGPALESWLDRFFESFYRHRPVEATFIGHHAHDRELPDASPAGIEAVLDEMSGLRADLAKLPDEPLSLARRIDRRLAEGFLDIQAWELGTGWFHRRNPAWYTGEAIFGVLSLLLRDFAPEPERVEAASARLAAIPRLLEEARSNVLRAPAAFVERALTECDAAAAFFESELPPGLATGSADDDARRAFSELRSHLERLETTDDYACGDEAFALLLERGHFWSESALEILERASDAIARLRPLTAHPPPDDEAPAPPERYYDRFQEIWEESRAFAIEHDLVTWPDYPVDFVPRPAWARKAAPKLYFLFYRAPAPFDDLPRLQYLVPPSDTPPSESVIKLNHVVHHAGIGHHIQNWHANRSPSRVGQVAAVDCASRIAMFCGGTMAEGWACYATDLMNEAGFLTPAESASERRAHVRQAARAVVDVALHLGRMDYERAARYYTETAGMSPAAARSEVTKNAMFPGAAVIYFLGSHGIHALRAAESKRLGAAFDLRRFHDRFLSLGSIPVSLAAEAMADD